MKPNWLKARRRELGLSQEELAARLQVQGIDYTAGAISHWETGRYSIPLEESEFRKALAEALKMSVTAMLIAAGYEVKQGYSEAAQHAAEIVDQLPPSRQSLAVSILEQLLREGA